MNRFVHIVLATLKDESKLNFVLTLNSKQSDQYRTIADQARKAFLFQIVKAQVLRNEPDIWYVETYQVLDRDNLAQLFQASNNCVLLSDNLRIRCIAEIARSTCSDHFNGQVVYPLEIETVGFYINNVMAEIIGIHTENLDFNHLSPYYKSMILNQVDSHFEYGSYSSNVEWVKAGSGMLLVDCDSNYWQVINVRKDHLKLDQVA